MLELRNIKKSFVEPGGGVLPILDIPHFRVETGEHRETVDTPDNLRRFHFMQRG